MWSHAIDRSFASSAGRRLQRDQCAEIEDETRPGVVTVCVRARFMVFRKATEQYVIVI